MPLAYIKILEGSEDVDPGYGVEGRPGYGGGHPGEDQLSFHLPPGIKPPPGHIWPPRIPPDMLRRQFSLMGRRKIQ